LPAHRPPTSRSRRRSAEAGKAACRELGQQQGIFKKHGLDLDILYTAGGGETLQAVISGAVDVGLSAGTLAILGAFQKGAPVRIIGASSTGSRELFWYVVADSGLQSMRDANDKTIAYSTAGSSTNIAVLRFIDAYGLKAKPVATGDVSATITQVMTRQVDVGWSVAPFNLKPLEEGRIRIIARASDLAAIRSQTIRVQTANLDALTRKKELIERFVAAYRETLDWMYAGPEAVERYLKFSGFPADASAAHAQGVHPQGEPADRAGPRPRRSDGGRAAIQIPERPTKPAAALGADPDSRFSTLNRAVSLGCAACSTSPRLRGEVGFRAKRSGAMESG
jgi:NitT/TauT family transport system substrate-binding protein